MSKITAILIIGGDADPAETVGSSHGEYLWPTSQQYKPKSGDRK